MKRYSSDKNINQTIRSLIKSGWSFRNGRKHSSVISPSGIRLCIPSTPSDYRAWYNFNRDIKHISSRHG
ncbi:phosphoribosylglycinamide formyltransferase [Marinobacter vinifirmus]|uniref:Phosphoribosylglycinamide formyltransferase n=1 Tax=Marinobacter vinifirmus TaxID=355591 RepID=A0A7Z1DSJ7_9GAMM|nr:phosphoribosylglycinamide formyltransferase [Marinobacter vinifirmus]